MNSYPIHSVALARSASHFDLSTFANKSIFKLSNHVLHTLRRDIITSSTLSDNQIRNSLTPLLQDSWLRTCLWLKMVFTTKLYVNSHYGNSKEFIQLKKGAMIGFKSTEQFDLKPSNADSFAEFIDKVSKSYAYYGMICRFPTTFLPDAWGTYTLGDHANLLKTWNQIGLDVVLKNSNMTWGGQDLYWRDSWWNPGRDSRQRQSYRRSSWKPQWRRKGALFEPLEERNARSSLPRSFDRRGAANHQDSCQLLRVL